MSVLTGLSVPIVQAPLAGGPSTPRLAAAVSNVGALGFVAAGYVDAARLEADMAEVRQLTRRPFGVNVFAPPGEPATPREVQAYAASLEADAKRLGVSLGNPRFDDDYFADKVELLCREPVPVVSFTFGLPPSDVLQRLRTVGSEIWLTVTSPDEAIAADALEPDALVVQGIEAGGHRGVHVDDDQASDLTLLAALQLIGAQLLRPLVAAGGLTTGASIAAALAAGAAAAQLGTAEWRGTTARAAASWRPAPADHRKRRGIRTRRWLHRFSLDGRHANPSARRSTAWRSTVGCEPELLERNTRAWCEIRRMSLDVVKVREPPPKTLRRGMESLRRGPNYIGSQS